MSVSDHSPKTRESNSSSGSDGESIRNGLVGGVVAVILSFLPLSEVLGGAIAGYLDRGTSRTGTAAGAIAGVVAFLPYLLVGLYIAAAPAIALPGPVLSLSREAIIAGVASVAFVYVVGLSVLGSLIGRFLS